MDLVSVGKLCILKILLITNILLLLLISYFLKYFHQHFDFPGIRPPWDGMNKSPNEDVNISLKPILSKWLLLPKPENKDKFKSYNFSFYDDIYSCHLSKINKDGKRNPEAQTQTSCVNFSLGLIFCPTTFWRISLNKDNLMVKLWF